jgi:hypothetical protein
LDPNPNFFFGFDFRSGQNLRILSDSGPQNCFKVIFPSFECWFFDEVALFIIKTCHLNNNFCTGTLFVFWHFLLLSFVPALCLAHYQTVLTILVATLLGFYILRQTANTSSGSKPSAAPPPPIAAALSQASSPSSSPASSSAPYLWTVDNSPIYGSPMFRRTTPTQVSVLKCVRYDF